MHEFETHARACPEYNNLSRRNFLAATGGMAALAATAPSWLPRVSLARDHRGAQRDVIVSIYLRGAADALSLVVPHQEQAYYDARPNLNVPRPDSGSANRCTDLDGFFGLHPLMTPLLPAYQDGNLLFVHACGSHDPSRSHFEAQRYMEVGVPADPHFTTGWLGRHLASIDQMVPGAILRGVGIANGLQKTLVGAPRTLPIPDLDNYGLTGYSFSLTQRRLALNDMYISTTPPLQEIGTTALATIDLLNTIDFAGYVPSGGAAYPVGGNGFGMSLRAAAALIKAQVGVEAIAIDLPGWDHHASQGVFTGAFATLANSLALGLSAFYADMFSGSAPSVTVVAMSEFGRRLEENGGAGTDHGHGGVMMVMGSCVNGGQVKRIWPGLEYENLFENKDLEVTIDYRDVLAEIIQARLGNNNLAYVFPNFTPTFRGVLSC